MAIFALASAAVSVATAAPKPIGEPPVVRALLDCRKVADNADRLACYDKAAAAMESATSSGDLVSIDREQRRAARRQAFGFSLPSLSFLERGEKAGELNHITSTATNAYRNSEGKWTVQLEDGAVWQQSEAEELGRTPHPGSKVDISKGMLGSFFMTIDGQGAGKARRVS
ncbi:MAG: hypothetical protein ACREEB_08035 [Caulobacteraceae bacterium]